MGLCLRASVIGELDQTGDEVSPIVLDNAFLGMQSPPEIGVGEASDEVFGCRFRWVVFRHHPPNAALADVFVELALHGLAAQVRCQEQLVLDDASVHIHDVETAVRAKRAVDRAEALVRTGKELALGPLLIRVMDVLEFGCRGHGSIRLERTHRVCPRAK